MALSHDRYIEELARRSGAASVVRRAIRRRRHRLAQAAPQISLIDFVREAWPVLERSQPYIENWHVEELSDVLEQVSAGIYPRVACNIPPGHMKSLLFSVFWPAWEWGPNRSPHLSYIACSHDVQLANRDNRKMRTLINSQWYQERWGALFKWAGDQRAKGFFANDMGGWRMSTSPSSGATGHRADRVVVDDIISARKVHSQKRRDAANKFARQELANRVNNETALERADGTIVPPSAFVAIGQRLHDDDLFGQIDAGLLGEGWEWVVMPSEYDPDDLMSTIVYDRRTKAGELLFPDRFPRHVIEDQKLKLGSVHYASQHRQKPTVPEGSIFLRANWSRYEWLPRHVDEWIISVDCAFKATSSSSNVALGVFARCGPDVYVVDIVAKRMGFAETVREITKMRETYTEARKLAIEDKANGPAIIELLSKLIPGIKPINPTDGKIARAWAIQPYQEAGNLYVPLDGVDPTNKRWGRLGVPNWQEAYVDEAAAFEPGSTEQTDQVDITSQAVLELLGDAVERARVSLYGLLY